MTLRADVVVAGSGAIGSVIALLLARAGRRVIVAEPGRLGENASGVAAGMLAPAFEALFDDTSHRRFALLREARGLWPPLADSLGLELDRLGALTVAAGQAEATAWARRLTELGAASNILTPAGIASVTPWIEGRWAVLTHDDWRLEPLGALRALREEADRLGVRRAACRVLGMSDGRVALERGDSVVAETLVVATGADLSLARLAPELQRLSPIKGQILRTRSPTLEGGPVVRGDGVYICPAPGELILGASMEPGHDDLAIDPRVVAGLIRRASSLSSRLRDLEWRASAGVRGATPDGLPLAGRASAPDVLLAVGARRNGWLLAPLIGQIVLEALEHRPASDVARQFDPARLAVSQPG